MASRNGKVDGVERGGDSMGEIGIASVIRGCGISSMIGGGSLAIMGRAA
jgi:hypothetical protein